VSNRAIQPIAEERGGSVDYFVWYDESTKKTAAEKIQEAIVVYTARFSIGPSLVLVNSIDQTELGGVQIRSEPMVQKNNFWLGIQAQSRSYQESLPARRVEKPKAS
jgi:hypothetical protein